MKPPEITINYKPNLKVSEMKQLNSSEEVAILLQSIWSDKLQYIEETYLLLLNRTNHILGYLKLSSGVTAATIVDVKMIFQTALKTNSHGIILAHNHPSSNLKPSTCDIELTKKIREAGKLMEIILLDHIILTSESYYSFADEQML